MGNDYVEITEVGARREPFNRDELSDCSIKVDDLADVPTWFRGEIALISDHGNVSLYVKTARGTREVWSIV